MGLRTLAEKWKTARKAWKTPRWELATTARYQDPQVLLRFAWALLVNAASRVSGFLQQSGLRRGSWV